MIQKDYIYTDGSAARKLQYDVYEENTVLREKKRYKNNKEMKFKFVLAILATFFAGITVIYRFAAITQLSYEINQHEKIYNELRNENSLLRVQIETKTDLADIKEVAEKELGMQMPDKNQIFYVKVPRNDYTIVANSANVQEKAEYNFLDELLSKVFGLVKLIEW